MYEIEKDSHIKGHSIPFIGGLARQGSVSEQCRMGRILCVPLSVLMCICVGVFVCLFPYVYMFKSVFMLACACVYVTESERTKKETKRNTERKTKKEKKECVCFIVMFGNHCVQI